MEKRPQGTIYIKDDCNSAPTIVQCISPHLMTSKSTQLFRNRTRIRNSYPQPLWLTPSLPHKTMGGWGG